MMRLPNLPSLPRFSFIPSLAASQQRLWARLSVLLLFSVVLHWVVLQWIVVDSARPAIVRANNMPLILHLNASAPSQERGSDAVSQQIKNAEQTQTNTDETPSQKVKHVSSKQHSTAPKFQATSLVSEQLTAIKSGESNPTITDGKNDYIVSPPLSATLRMQISRTAPLQADAEGQMELVWRVAGRRYTLTLNATLKTPNGTSSPLYAFQSAGAIDAYGLAPDSASIARRGRSEMALHFDRTAQRVSFSSSNSSSELTAGLQDRASLFVQLAGIATADPAQIVEGKLFTLDVAEERGVSTFDFVVVERERLSTALGEVDAWHLRRVLPIGSSLARLDVWLAPSYHWLPVQIQTTEMNGIVTRQTLTHIEF